MSKKSLDIMALSQELKSRPLATQFLKPARKTGFVCPYCDNGSGKDGTGIVVSKENDTSAKCFRCGKTINNIDVFAAKIGVSTSGKDFVEAVKEGCNYFGIDTDNYFTDYQKKSVERIHPETGEVLQQKPIVPQKSPEEIAKERQYLNCIHQDLLSGNDHLEKISKKDRRGLTLETLRVFDCKYEQNWLHPTVKLEGNPKHIQPSRRLIIPTEDGEHYNAVLLQSDRTDQNKKVWKMHAGPMQTFALNSIHKADEDTVGTKYVFVFEGEIDAMSAWQTWQYSLTTFEKEVAQMCRKMEEVSFIATLGAARRGWIQEVDERCKSQNICPLFIINFDNDEAGRLNAEKCQEELWQLGYPAIMQFLTKTNYMPLQISNSVEKAKAECKEKIDFNSFLCQWGELSATRIIDNGLISDERIAQLRSEAKEYQQQFQRKVAARKAREAAAQAEAQKVPPKDEFDFIKNSSDRAAFIELRNAPQSEERDAAIRKIITNNLVWKYDRHGKPKYPLSTAANFRKVFTYDPILPGLFATEEFTGETIFLKQPPWRKKNCINKNWTDTDDAFVRLYIRENYAELAGKELVADFVNTIADENSFNVVAKYLESLPQWDGKPRAETLFIDFLRVNDTHYARQVTMNWLFGALARIFYPGCEYQTALVLQGAQHIGKGTVAKLLGNQWYTTLKDSVDDSHSLDVIKTGWIVEIEEFSAAKKADVSALKAFISASADDRREPYARRAKKYLRHCVFVMTCNEEQFLKDRTGNRRFLVLKCNSKKFDYVEGLTDEYIQQVWAEALFKFNEFFIEGFDDKKLILPRKLLEYAEDVAEQFTLDDSMEGEISAFLDVPIPEPVVWNVLTKAEKRSFFVNRSITLEKAEWHMRGLRLRGVEKFAYLEALKCSKENIHTRQSSIKDKNFITVYGSCYRKETCAVEIYNECFGSDKRRSIYRIAEALSQLTGWRRVGRVRNFNGYNDQKNVYRRTFFHDEFELKEQGDNFYKYNEEKHEYEKIRIGEEVTDTTYVFDSESGKYVSHYKSELQDCAESLKLSAYGFSIIEGLGSSTPISIG